MTGGERLTLCAGELSVDILPALGGSIGKFEWVVGTKRQQLFRGDNGAAHSALDTGCFPMVPYVNRIRGGTFDCDGKTVRLAPNMAGDSSPLHGQGWLGRWTVTDASECHAVMSFVHDAGEWLWNYDAQQHIELDPDGLSVTLSCTNRSPDRMPCGLGLHPYYPCDAETVFDTKVESAWTIDAAVLPVENVPATGRYDLHDRRICGQSLDNGFDGWSGNATIRWPGKEVALRLSSFDAQRLQIYSPEGGGLFVAEPVQQANAALNEPQECWAELGVTLLETGETASISARFSLIR